MLLHVQVEDVEVRVWLGVVKELSVDKLVGTSFIIGYVRDTFSYVRRITQKFETCLHQRVRAQEQKITNAVVANDRLTEPRTAWRYAATDHLRKHHREWIPT